MTYKEAINKLKNEYDAFYIDNKYGEGTHNEEFKLLSTLKGEKVSNALSWIKDCYDCYYKDELPEDNPFNYLESLLGETETIPIDWLKRKYFQEGVYAAESYFRTREVVKKILEDWKHEVHKSDL